MTKDPGPAEISQAGFSHRPVLLEEAIDLLNVRSGLTYVDATAGGGGHLAAIVEKLGNAGTPDRYAKNNESRPSVFAIDRDASALAALSTRLPPSVSLIHSNFSDIKAVLSEVGHDTVTGGILADIGVASMQLDDPDRGFSFLYDGPLDMRMDTSQSTTAEELINNSSERELAEIIFRYGEERYARRVARGIVKARPLHSTLELAAVVASNVKRSTAKRGSPHSYLHPATRTFQAIRIAVNNELDSLEKFLRDSIKLLSPGARLVVITFHSLEDRLVKQIFREASVSCLCPPRQPVCTCHHKRELLIITRKPIVAAEKEVLANIRSRSAKLRAGEKSG